MSHARNSSEQPDGGRPATVIRPRLRALLLLMAALGVPQGCGLIDSRGEYRDLYSGVSYTDAFVAVEELLDRYGNIELADHASGRIETAWRADDLFRRRGVERRSQIVARITQVGDQVAVDLRVKTEVRRPGPDSSGWTSAANDDQEAAVISQELRMRMLTGRPEEVAESAEE